MAGSNLARTPSNGTTPAVVRVDPRIETVRGLLIRMVPELRKALPRHMDPERMARLALTAIRKSPELLACTADSLMASVMQAAQLGFEIDNVLGHAYLVPFNDRRRGVKEATLLPGYKGLILLARRSKQIDTIEGKPVFEADEFDFEYGTKSFLRHRPSPSEDRGRLVYAWAMTWFRGASHPQFDVLSRADIEARRSRSRQRDSGPWSTDYAAMALKTAFRAHAKIWPLTAIERAIVEAEDMIDADVQPSMPTDLDATQLPGPVTRSSQLANALASREAAPESEESPAGTLPEASSDESADDDDKWEDDRE